MKTLYLKKNLLLFALVYFTCIAVWSQNINEFEYFFGADPGFGNGTMISANTNAGELTQDLSIPITGLNEGFHQLTVRALNNDGTWGLYEKKTFFVLEEAGTTDDIADISNAEYWFDNDPGFGNGTPVTIVSTGNLNTFAINLSDEFTSDLSTTNVNCDFHDFYIRLVNADGTWSFYDYGLQVEVFDNADPTIVVFPDITVALDANGQASLALDDVNNGTFDDCELVSVALNQAQFDYTCANLGANLVTITATDAESKVSTQDVTITVEDNINPLAIAQNIMVELDANGLATITVNDLDNGSSDNCSIINRSVDISSFTCDNLGPNTVNFTVEDASGNTNSVNAIVTVVDNLFPIANAQNISIQLDANGLATLSADDIDSSTDNCTIATKSIDISSFDCSNLGPNTVTLNVTDTSGNSSSITAVVTVQDIINPVAVAQNISVQLDENGLASITANDLENGSSDNCSLTNTSINKSSLTCDDLGEITVTFTVEDTSGNSSSTSAVVTVEDNLDPIAIGQDITVDLAGNNSITISAEEVNNGSSDNCNNIALSIDMDTFTATGDFPVILSVEDQDGNLVSVIVTVTVIDSSLGIDEEEIGKNYIKIYPNPTKNVLFFETKGIIKSLSIIDMTGKTVLNQVNTQNQIEVECLSQGVYFIRLNLDDTTVIKRFIKQ